jgi:hypothetical protein
MNYKSKLNQIRVVLGLSVKLATAKLKDGTVVEAEEFAPGSELFVVAEDGSKVPAPAGEHTGEDGTVFMVDESGKIVSVESSEKPAIEVEVETEAVKASEETEEVVAEEATPIKDAVEERIAEAMTKVAAAIEPIAKDVAEMKQKMAKMEEQYAKFSKAPAASKVPVINERDFSSIKTNVDIVDRFNELKSSFNK